MGSNSEEIRITPYPPSFRRTAARTIEPAIGASTWAFGNQRWTPYRGIFTRKAKRQASQRPLVVQTEKLVVGVSWVSGIDKVPIEFCRHIRATNNGREPARV